MDRNELQALIDRVIGKKGILRAPSYWVRRVFGNLMDYTDGKAEESKAYTDDAVKNVKITVDSEMSDESENAVSNKAIKGYVDNTVNTLSEDIAITEDALAKIVDKVYGPPLYIDALEDITISLSIGAMLCSRNRTDWMSPSELGTIYKDTRVYLKIKNPGDDFGTIKTNGTFNIGGNIMSMIYGDAYYKDSLEGRGSAFFEFLKESQVVDASQLVLASDTTEYCYYDMFHGCTKLRYAPKSIGGVEIAESACEQMFYGCTSLETAPEILATSVDTTGCRNMFYGCTSLETAAKMAITGLGLSALSGMYQNCTSLKVAPELPSTSLGNNCYERMFYGCTSLETAPELPATESKSDCYNAYAYMFYGCTSLKTAPVLPFKTVQRRMYQSMFNGCTSLNYIKILATSMAGSDCLSNWVSGVSTTGTFVKVAGVSFPTGVNGIPEGWTVEEVEV